MTHPKSRKEIGALIDLRPTTDPWLQTRSEVQNMGGPLTSAAIFRLGRHQPQNKFASLFPNPFRPEEHFPTEQWLFTKVPITGLLTNNVMNFGLFLTALNQFSLRISYQNILSDKLMSIRAVHG